MNYPLLIFIFCKGSYLVDTITEAGVRNLKPTRQFLYLSRWWGNNTGSVTRHDLITKKNYYVTNSTIRPGQMVYISDQAISVQGGVVLYTYTCKYFTSHVTSAVNPRLRLCFVFR